MKALGYTFTTFSLLNVYVTNPDGTVDGTWVQDHTGTLESARAAADKTEIVNFNKIIVKVVKGLSWVPNWDYQTNLKVLA